MRTTPWYPGSINPVTVGLYEVETDHRAEFGKLDLGVSAAFVRWEKRAGQFGFWLQENQIGPDATTHAVSTLIVATRWRGLVRPVLSVAGRLALANILGAPSPKVRARAPKSAPASEITAPPAPVRRKVLANRTLI